MERLGSRDQIVGVFAARRLDGNDAIAGGRVLWMVAAALVLVGPLSSTRLAPIFVGRPFQSVSWGRTVSVVIAEP